MTTASLGCDPTYALLKSEPRFIAVAKQLGQEMCKDNVPPIIPARAPSR